MTWTDRREGRRSTYLQRLDDQLQAIGEPVALTPPELPVARAVVCGDGGDRLALLMQVLRPPQRVNAVMVVSGSGEVVMQPVTMEAPGEVGRFGGAIDFDGEAFQALWRSSRGRDDTLRWARFGSQMIEPPRILAAEREGPLDGGFLPFSAVALLADEGGAWIGFSRQARQRERAPSTSRHHVLRVDRRGRPTTTKRLPAPSPLTQDNDLRLLRRGGEPMALWSRTDLAQRRPVEALLVARLNLRGPFIGPPRRLRRCPGGCQEMLAVGGRMIAVSAEALWSAPWSARGLGPATTIAPTSMTPGLVLPSAITIDDRIAITWIDERRIKGRLRTEVWLGWLGEAVQKQR